ncbi:hypothetical protein [Sorangium sp. So ce131]|uniref:hypothetical protein n=1 Tax=Sorangium sp. So ce131 TaxID=3133282 RepID=UPI003F6382CA
MTRPAAVPDLWFPAAIAAAGALWWWFRRPVALPRPGLSLRQEAVSLVRRFVPSDTGDAAFEEIAKDYGGKGTTCGYICHWLLWRIGCRDATVVNRNEPGDGLTYRPARNISMLRWNTYFRVASRDARPEPGDIYLVSDGPPPTEHVGVVLDVAGDVWTTADAGQPNVRGEQCARLVKRRLRADGALERLDGASPPRRLQGWLDLERVPRSAPARLDGPREVHHVS